MSELYVNARVNNPDSTTWKSSEGTRELAAKDEKIGKIWWRRGNWV